MRPVMGHKIGFLREPHPPRFPPVQRGSLRIDDLPHGPVFTAPGLLFSQTRRRRPTELARDAGERELADRAQHPRIARAALPRPARDRGCADQLPNGIRASVGPCHSLGGEPRNLQVVLPKGVQAPFLTSSINPWPSSKMADHLRRCPSFRVGHLRDRVGHLRAGSNSIACQAVLPRLDMKCFLSPANGSP